MYSRDSIWSARFAWTKPLKRYYYYHRVRGDGLMPWPPCTHLHWVRENCSMADFDPFPARLKWCFLNEQCYRPRSNVDCSHLDRETVPIPEQRCPPSNDCTAVWLRPQMWLRQPVAAVLSPTVVGASTRAKVWADPCQMRPPILAPTSKTKKVLSAWKKKKRNSVIIVGGGVSGLFGPSLNVIFLSLSLFPYFFTRGREKPTPHHKCLVEPGE